MNSISISEDIKDLFSMPNHIYTCNYKILTKSSDRRSVIFAGYASVFNIVDSDMDMIMNGAFKHGIVDNTIRILWQHDMNQQIGFVTMILEDNYGLYIEGVIFSNTLLGKKIVDMISRGVVSGLSIGYSIAKNNFLHGVNHIHEIDLVEISIVPNPANEYARIIAIDEETVSSNSLDVLDSLRFEVSRLKLLV